MLQNRVKDRCNIRRANLGRERAPPDQSRSSRVESRTDYLNHGYPGKVADDRGEKPNITNQEIGLETIHDAQFPLHFLLHGLGGVESIPHNLEIEVREKEICRARVKSTEDGS